MPRATTPPAPHPADARRAAVLANPAGFTASVRFNGRNNTLPAATLAAAAVNATRLEAGVSALGGTTRATVYALPADGGGPEVVARDVWLAYVTPATRAAIVTEIAARTGAAHG